VGDGEGPAASAGPAARTSATVAGLSLMPPPL
jgi:hypothetical protein